MKILMIRLSSLSIEHKDNLKVGVIYSDVLDIILIPQLLDEKSGVLYSTEPGRWIDQRRLKSPCRHVVQIKGLSLFPFRTILRVQVTFQHYEQQWEI